MAGAGGGEAPAEVNYGELDARVRRAKDPGAAAKGWWFRFWTGWRAEPDARSVEPPADWKPREDRIGVCCSGGGIRSAAYSLGALQRLQRAGVLQQARYLSAVSGGSYIATAMTIARRDASDPFAPGSPEERYLRNRTDYLVPHGNEAVFLGYRMVLGIAINALLVGLVLGILAIVLGLFYESVDIAEGGQLAVERWAMCWVVLPLAGSSLLLALFYLLARLSRWGRRRPRDPGDDAPAGPDLTRLALQTWVVRLFWVAVVAAFALAAVPALTDWALDPPSELALPAIPAASAATFLAALLSQLLAKAPKEPDAKGELTRAAALRPKLLRALAGVAATVAVPLMAIAWVVAVVAWTVSPDVSISAWCAGSLEGSRLEWLPCLDGAASHGDAITVALLGGATVLAFLLTVGDLTSWSLHPFYRSRLASVFALTRDGERARALDTYREIPAMHELQPPRPADPAKLGDEQWPTLVVCAAANVSDRGATPFGRPVTSFTFSAEGIGGPLVGYVSATEYEKRKVDGRVTDERARSDAMTAVAVSGAAISPSMGKLTYRAGRALLALGNIRLGIWMPNPRNTPGDSGASEVPRRPRPYRLLLEMLGKNSLRDRYLYVTDGGHYENLGLVELLRRGCTRIYCFDGGGGRGIGAALGDAIALARSELQVDIVVDPEAMAALEPDENGISAADHVVADIHYPTDGYPSPAPTGKLIYARQLLTAAAPQDVHAHARRNPKFPHDPTSDQFLTDQAFESYRALGRLAADNALAEPLGR